MNKPILQSVKEIQVRFSELDVLQIVWHGNYIKYFEDGREDFGKKYDIAYINLRNAGIATPIINVNCDYKKSLSYPETILIETTYKPTKAAKIVLKYRVLKKETKEVMAEGQTTQVFTDFDGNLLLCSPEFYTNWKQKWGVD